MTLLDFDRTVAAIAEVVARQSPVAAPDRDAVAEVVAFVLATHAKMPDYLRLGFRVLTLVFAASSVLRHGQPFDRLSSDRQARQVARWEKSSFGFQRGLVAFYRTFTVFGLYTPPAASAPRPQRRHLSLVHDG